VLGLKTCFSASPPEPLLTLLFAAFLANMKTGWDRREHWDRVCKGSRLPDVEGIGARFIPVDNTAISWAHHQQCGYCTALIFTVFKTRVGPRHTIGLFVKEGLYGHTLLILWSFFSAIMLKEIAARLAAVCFWIVMYLRYTFFDFLKSLHHNLPWVSSILAHLYYQDMILNKIWYRTLSPQQYAGFFMLTLQGRDQIWPHEQPISHQNNSIPHAPTL
jgi:hypothetical protein